MAPQISWDSVSSYATSPTLADIAERLLNVHAAQLIDLLLACLAGDPYQCILWHDPAPDMVERVVQQCTLNPTQLHHFTMEASMNAASLRGPGYTLSVHDNTPSSVPPVAEGQNGIRIWRVDDDPDVRVIAHSWLNLEHIITQDLRFSGNREDPGFFEPRQYPVNLEQGQNSVRLYHDALPRTGCACWIEYTPGNQPGMLDFQLGFTPTRRIGEGEVIGVFLPCYIHQPESKSIRFIGRTKREGRKRWVEYCSSCHHSIVNFAWEEAQHLPTYESTDFAKGQDTARYSYPFVWGQIGAYVWLLMVQGSDEVETRFWMSPEGGGFDSRTHQTNPAWDFLALAFGYELEREYTAHGRLILRRTMTPQDAIAEYEAWSGTDVQWDE